jgi:dipeptidyl aminopeptidase/acylaminoacyl peptidase
LWVRGGALVAQRLDVAQRALSGDVLTVADGLNLENAGGRSAVSASATGVVAYRTTKGSERQLTWFDRSGVARGVVGEPDVSLLTPRVSPDGRRLAVTRTVQDNPDIWLWDGARWTRFTLTPGRDAQIVWPADGTRIVYQSLGRGLGEIQSRLTSGAGGEEPLLGADQVLTPTSVATDGRFLMYMTIDPVSTSDLWVVPLGDGAKPGTPSLYLKTSFREAYGVFSPDGRWVAGVPDEGHQAQSRRGAEDPPGVVCGGC